MVTESGQAKILDFGLAKLMESDIPVGTAHANAATLPNSEFLTAQQLTPRPNRPKAKKPTIAPIFFRPAFCFTKCSPEFGRFRAKP